MIYLRPAKEKDANNLFMWKNDRTVRKFSIVSNEKISLDEHLLWLKRNIWRILIITDGKIDYGDIRVCEKGEIAIKLDKKYRGKGISYLALKRYLKTENIAYAKIVDGNVSSMRLFQRLGFKVFKHKVANNIGYYILKYERHNKINKR